MALTLNDVGKSKGPSKKKAAVRTTQQIQTQIKKVRPWQTPEEIKRIEERDTQEGPQPLPMEWAGRPLPQEVVEILQKVEVFKNDCLTQLPPEFGSFMKDSWVTKLQVYPKIKIPVPKFLVHKEK